MSICGEIAEEKAGSIGIGSFHVAIMDAISNLNDDVILSMAKVKLQL